MAFRLVLITPEAPAPNEPELLRSLFSRGLQTLHIRRLRCDEAAVAETLAALPPEARCRCVLHQHHVLAKRFSVGGIHYPERERPAGVIRAPPGLSVSTSLHALADLGICWGQLDYAFLSPIYHSISKPGAVQ